MYYDSQGLSSDDPTRVKRYPDFNMRKDLEALGDKLFPKETFTIEENQDKHQTDTQSCAVYVLTMMHWLASRLSLETASKDIASNLLPNCAHG